MVAQETEDRDVRALTASLSDLHIEGEGNNVCINVTISGSADTPRATSAPKASAPASKAAGKAKPSGKRKRFYVICTSKKEPALKGIWEAEWKALEQKLPGGDLCGSGCWPCKGFDSWDAAAAFWSVKLPEEETPHTAPCDHDGGTFY